ncbi:DUF5709 domain-containing protein [Rhodococcus sp. HM1]|uniref:DUF5709 domain-containing protein n=1 Tax=unclassified Rhodococcus (in: high G+C Gram-positive bacteria) TaxID=192944 RepID=UPI0018CDFF67|nr:MULTISPECIES: DUF5709 domain-containing protein [unclassified Rhodococcus (in: high G+C Gram-positive bacteria)]MBH0122500.1 hypothetical protein [Rhodococcus sp. CX]MCK8674540.1 DUF5709 domain-containing protein [Rhodococcus sp. HM1]
MNIDDARDDGYGGEYSVDEDNQLQPEDTLDDRGVADMLDEGYSPPERPLAMNATGTTGDEVRYGGSLAHRISAEEPDPAFDTSEPDVDAVIPGQRYMGEVGDRRAGRLVAHDDGLGSDEESELWAGDAGIDGGAASAEEAAVHVIEEEE